MRRTRLKRIADYCTFLYCVVGSLAATVFLFDYARENNVIAWILLGPLIASLKGTFWPFFVWVAWRNGELAWLNGAPLILLLETTWAGACWLLARWGGAHRHRVWRRGITAAVVCVAAYSAINGAIVIVRPDLIHGAEGPLFVALGEIVDLAALWLGWRTGVARRRAIESRITIRNVATGVTEPLFASAEPRELGALVARHSRAV